MVEVKRSTDTHIRREVVAQMLDYAANAAVFWQADILRERFEANCQHQDRSPHDKFNEIFGDSSDDEIDTYEDYWQLVQVNLDTSRLRLLFVADEIPPALRRIVEFLNEQMERIEILAIKVKQYVGGGLKTLVPRVIGQSAVTQQKKSPSHTQKRQWDESSFFQELNAQKGEIEVTAAYNLLKWIWF